MSNYGALEQRIRVHAAELGFDSTGFTAAALPSETYDRFHQFLELGRHGEMDWLLSRSEQRAHPQSLWPDAKSIIMLGLNYGPESDPMAALENKTRGAISVYAQNKDYHDLFKKRLKRLARWLIENEGGDVKVFVDTAPVMEKPLAAQAGIGWQGKHTNLISREHGSWLFLGAIFTTLALKPDPSEEEHCGSCQRCLDICPTEAFPAPYQLDARRCISYLTIEHKGAIAPEFRKAIGNHIYGCDDCLAVCPWNKFAHASHETAFHAREVLKNPPLADLAVLDDAAFRKLFSGSPIKRTGRDRFIRNILIAIGNSEDKSLLEYAVKLLRDENSLVRGAAVWACAELASETQFDALKKQNAPVEDDESVLIEWRQVSARQ